MEASSVNLQELDNTLLAPTYIKADMEFSHGEGSWLFTRQGEKVLDFVTGIAVNALGHGHKAVQNAIVEQSQKYLHLSNLYINEPQLSLAQELLKTNPNLGTGAKAFFANSGTEANEGAIKFARKYFDRQGQGQRQQIVTFVNSFHGRTFGALAATGQPALKQGFGTMPGDFVHLEWNDSETLRRTVNAETCAIMLEPIAAEGGILTPNPEFIATINELRQKHGCLVIVDEIQTGLGRCGAISGAHKYDLDHDISTWAKALGGGLPLGMILLRKKVAAQIKPGDHGTTFGGNPVSCAAGLAVLKTVNNSDFLANLTERSEQIQAGLQKLGEKYSWLGEIRGAGLLLGIRCTKPVGDLIAACRSEGLLAHRAGADILRLLPPLNVSENEVELALSKIDAACATMN
ncbi:MAG: acetylornithine/succinylornithine family transaminase [Fibrobacter sp.]|nr:acetylornithine/succinylornithine family transaminase [Fibrobacter sp.]